MQLAARSLPKLIPDTGIESPITELIAAIEAEQARAEKSRAAARPLRRRVAQRPPARQLVVQQLPGRSAPPPRRIRARARNESPLEPLLTKLFGPDDRVTAQRTRRAPAHYLQRVRYLPADNRR